MPAESKAQAGLAVLSLSPEGRAKLRRSGRTPMPRAAAEEYAPQKGQSLKSLPRHVRRK